MKGHAGIGVVHRTSTIGLFKMNLLNSKEEEKANMNEREKLGRLDNSQWHG